MKARTKPHGWKAEQGKRRGRRARLYLRRPSGRRMRDCERGAERARAVYAALDAL